MTIGPAPILALLVGVFHVSVYALVRDGAGRRLPVLVVAAFLGAWAGDALAGRLGLDPVRIGDFHLVGASALAWVGIVVVALVAELGRREPPVPRRVPPTTELVAPPHAPLTSEPPPRRDGHSPHEAQP